MTREELLEKLNYFISNKENIDVELFTLYKEGDLFQTYQPALEDKVLKPKVLQDSLNEIKEAFYGAEATSTELKSIHSPEEEENQIYFASYQEIPKAKEIFRDILLGKSYEYDESLKLTKLWAIVYKIGNSERSVYLFKKNSPINVVQHGKLYHFFFANKELMLIDKDTLHINPKFDVMLIDNSLIIINKKEFEKSFNYIEAMQGRAMEKITMIEKLNIVEDISKLRDYLHHKPTLKRILNVSTNNVVLKTPVKQIASFCKKYNVSLRFTKNVDKIDISTKKCAEQFLKLLNDDYLQSELTQLKYDSKGKKPIQ